MLNILLLLNLLFFFFLRNCDQFYLLLLAQYGVGQQGSPACAQPDWALGAKVQLI